MAFPASPSDNQVHKETNGRSYVYDSTLGTWDRISAADALSSESGGGSLGTISEGTLEDSVNFPTFCQAHQKHIVYTGDYGVGDSTTLLLNGVISRLNVTLIKANARIFWTLSCGDAYSNDVNQVDMFMCYKAGQDSLWKNPHGHVESDHIVFRSGGAHRIDDLSMTGVFTMSNVAGEIFCFCPAFKRSAGSGTYYSNYLGSSGRGIFTIMEVN